MIERYTTNVQSVKTRKQIAAEETQRVIVEAASRLFLEHGYHATSIGSIASEAGVAVQTIYNAVGKPQSNRFTRGWASTAVRNLAAISEAAP